MSDNTKVTVFTQTRYALVELKRRHLEADATYYKLLEQYWSEVPENVRETAAMRECWHEFGNPGINGDVLDIIGKWRRTAEAELERVEFDACCETLCWMEEFLGPVEKKLVEWEREIKQASPI